MCAKGCAPYIAAYRRLHLCRADFEALAGDFFARVAAVPAALLARTGLTAGSLDAVELLGGGSRIPAVQAAVSAALSGRALDKCALNCWGPKNKEKKKREDHQISNMVTKPDSWQPGCRKPAGGRILNPCCASCGVCSPVWAGFGQVRPYERACVPKILLLLVEFAWMH